MNNVDDNASPFMKAPKRKRLAKACDACHKSKRRCDGTAPCSNCYYASKQCTYTDAAGRPVPAPRLFKPNPQPQQQPLSADSRNVPTPSSSVSNQFRIYPKPPRSHPQNHPTENDHQHARKRFRNERGNPMPVDDLVVDDPAVMDRPNPIDLDPSLTRELTNLFFTHCHPARTMVHKPTFSTALSHNRVPTHLLLAICAVAAPLSKQPRIRTTPARFAGRPFAQEALSRMFDNTGRFVVEPDLAAAQALCILQMHDILTNEKGAIWSSRFHDLALQIVESLGVHSPEHPTLTPVPSPEFIQRAIEREAIRRIFWLIHVLDLTASIYFKKPVTFTDSDLRLRLPVDETSFELGVHSTLPEYLYLPAVRMQYASEFGHLIRILTIFTKMEYVLDELNDPKVSTNPIATLNEAEQKMDEWDRTLPDHLRFSEQSLQVQQSMFETSSNTGAWCWCMLHIYHASCALALNCVRERSSSGPSNRPCPQWAVERIELILKMLGDRAKNSILLGCALWSLVKYCKRDDSQIRKWADDYDEHWGITIFDLVQDSRPHMTPPIHHPSQSQQPLLAHGRDMPHEVPHRRFSDVRNAGPQHSFGHNQNATTDSRPPPLNHQHATGSQSYTNSNLHNHFKRSGSDSPRSPILYTPGQLQSSSSSRGSSGNQSDSTASEGNGIRSAASVGPRTDSMTGSHGKGRDQSSSRWSHIGTEASGNGTTSGESSSRYSGGTTGSRLSGSNNVSDAGGGESGGSNRRVGVQESSIQRNVQLPSEGGQSLPSLKASGLLDSWGSPWKTGLIEAHPNSGLQRPSHPGSPRRISPPVANLSMLTVSQAVQSRPRSEATDLRATSVLKAVPVGLPWLAKESR